MTSDAMIITGIVVAVISAIAISFFKTKSTPVSDVVDSQEGPSTKEMLEQLKLDLEHIKRMLEEEVQD